MLAELLGAHTIVPIPNAGIVRFHADHEYLVTPYCEHTRGLDREAWERGFVLHHTHHQPDMVVVVAHDDCKGSPGDSEAQIRMAISAARNLQTRLHNFYHIDISVVPVFERQIAELVWAPELVGDWKGFQISQTFSLYEECDVE